MPTDPWWGWVLLGRLHPLVVHFPIGLLIAGAAHELVQWARGRAVPSQVGVFCLSLGVVAGGLAVWFGTLNANHQSITGESAVILEWHRYAGWAMVLVGLAALLVAVVARARPSRHLAGAYTALVLVAAACVGAAGHFGGQLVYGSTYVTSVLPWNSAETRTAEATPSHVVGGEEPSGTNSVPVVPEVPSPDEDGVAPLADDAGPMPAPAAPIVAPVAPAPPPPAPRAAGPPAPPSSAGRASAPESAESAEPTAPPPPEPTPPVGVAARVDFARDVRPIFEATCVECHGPDKVKARLRMDSVAALQQGGKSGPLVVPGDPETSLIMRRVLGLDGEDQMPLDNDPLSDAQLETLRRWIAEGASFGSGTRTEP